MAIVARLSHRRPSLVVLRSGRARAPTVRQARGHPVVAANREEDALPRPRSAAVTVAVFAVVGFVAAGWSAAVASPRPATDPTPATTCTETPAPYEAALPSGTHTSPSPSASPTCPPQKMPFALDVVCMPDPHHVILKITNGTHQDERFVLRMVGTHVEVKGEARAGDSTLVKVAWTSPDDRWVLKIDDKRLTVKVGKPDRCHKPTKSPTQTPTKTKSPSMTPSESPTSPSESPSASPSKTPHLPVTGGSMTSIGGLGLGLLGAGTLAVLIARRRRALD
jgi:hypothetical protein